MATGNTKKNWKNTANIISKDSNFDFGSDYILSYDGKVPCKEILDSELKGEYRLLYQSDKSLLTNQLFYGDNLDVLKLLLKNFKTRVKLIYIDPPYSTNSVFLSREQKESFKDDLTGAHFIEFLRQRLILLKELLTDDGSIYIHLDNKMTFQIKVIMDEVFGAKNFRSCITRKKCSNKNYTKNSYGNISDYILFYSKGTTYTWNRPLEPWEDEKISKEYNNIDNATGRKFKKVPIHAPGVRFGETGKEWKGMLPPEGKHWQFIPSKLDELDARGDIYWSSNGNPRRKVYFDESKGIPVQDIWLDCQDSLNQNIKITGYPTEKNPKLLDRIIKASSNEGDIVLDCFAGSGTTLAVAAELKRRWIGVDSSSEAIEHIFKRFTTGAKAMGDFVENKKSKKQHPKLFEEEMNGTDIKNLTSKFSFFSDLDHLENGKQLVEKWFKQ